MPIIHPETHNWEEFSANYDYSKSLDELIEVWSDKAVSSGEWGGCPFLDAQMPLAIEKNYPYQNLNGSSLKTLIEDVEAVKTISEMAYYRWQAAGCPHGRDEEFWLAAELEHDTEDEKVWVEINNWFSKRIQSEVSIWKHIHTDERQVTVKPINWTSRLTCALNSYSLGSAWSLTAELKATELLRSHIDQDQFHSYMLTGCFVEKSKRSRLDYMFRKGRPTLVFSSGSDYKLITTLCSHTTGYYIGTWAGVHVPTDDVVAQLLRMRHDEYKYWKQSNQHPPHLEISGV